jgi:hypothetical protein
MPRRIRGAGCSSGVTVVTSPIITPDESNTQADIFVWHRYAPQVRLSDAREGPLVHAGRGDRARPGHRCQQHGLHVRERRPAARSSVSTRRPDRSREFAQHRRRQYAGRVVPDFEDWRAQARTFSSLAAYQRFPTNISDGGHPPERAGGVRVSTNAFSIIGEAPIRGRDFKDGEDHKGAEPVAILGYGLWKHAMAPTHLIGRSIKINDVPTTIIGMWRRA